MNFEKSCGAVVFRDAECSGEKQRYVLMIKHSHNSNHSFPKGHVESGESEIETAQREVFEETAVQVRPETADFRETVHYFPLPGVSKEVVYFLAKTTQKEIHPREGEIAEVEWVPIDKAEESLSHENDKAVFRAAMKKYQEGEIFAST